VRMNSMRKCTGRREGQDIYPCFRGKNGGVAKW
jgi:hypothetical protein